MEKNSKYMMLGKVAAYASAAPLALMAFISSAGASSGISLTADVVTGAQAGLTESAGAIEDTVNNQYFFTLALMFIGFAVVVGAIMFFVKGHRRI